MQAGTVRRKGLCILLCVALFLTLAPGIYAKDNTPAGGAQGSPGTGDMQLMAALPSSGGVPVLVDLSATTPAGAGFTFDPETKVVTITNSGNLYVITGTTTTNSVAVSGAGNFIIALQEASITSTDKVPLECAGATVNLMILGTNSLVNNGSGAAIHTPSGSSMTIGGDGTLSVQGGEGGAGIGGNRYEAGGNITITSGTITAKGGDLAAGIGGGLAGSGGAVVILGGSVRAIAGDEWAMPIGMGVDSSPGGTVRNALGADVYLTTVTLRGASAGVLVSTLTATLNGLAYVYAVGGMKTDNLGKLYLYLPNGTHTTAASAGGTAYSGDVATTADSAAQGELVPRYTVTFNSQGGSAVSSMAVQPNALITAPPNPSRSGFTFSGWYKEAACTNAWNFSADRVQGNTTLYAKWTQPPVVEPDDDDDDPVGVTPGGGPNPVTVTPPIIPQIVVLYKVAFETWGGGTVAPRWGGPGEKISAPADPTHPSGLVFCGWYKDPTGTQPWNFATDTIANSDIILYAKWWCKIDVSPNDPKYGSTTGSGIYAPLTRYTAKAYPKEGAIFNYWTENGVKGSSDITYSALANKSLNVKAVFSAKSVAPSVSAVPASISTILLRWKAVSDAAYYEIYMQEVGKTVGEYSFRAKTTALSYTDGGLLFQRQYNYKVRPVFTDKAGNVIGYGLSGTASSAPQIVIPTVDAKSENGVVQITWAATEGANYYRLYRQVPTQAYMEEILRTSDANTRSYTDKKGDMGRLYVYVVRAYAALTSYAGGARSKITEFYGERGSNFVTRVPGKPSLSATRSKNRKSIDLSWTSAAEADHYEIFSAVKGGGFNMIKDRYSIYHSWTNSGLDTNLSYWYKVRAYAFDKNDNKVYGEFSNLAEVP